MSTHSPGPSPKTPSPEVRCLSPIIPQSAAMPPGGPAAVGPPESAIPV
jgi:hypothetical protein